MRQVIHATAGVIAALCIVTFFISTVLVELAGTAEDVALVKSLIVLPGLLILVPAIAITGATGFLMAGQRKTGLVGLKKKRMPIIAANGMLVLVPAAIYLDYLASADDFSLVFYLVQCIELVAGLINLSLIALNMRDGLKLSGRLPWRTKTGGGVGRVN